MLAEEAAICRCLICQDYGDRDRLDNVDAKLINDISETGWGVLAIPEDEITAGWAFTVGLWHTYRSPEIATFGLEPTVMMRCLNAVGDRIAAGHTFAANDELDEILSGDYRVTLRSVDDGWRKLFFGTSMGFYRATPMMPFLQLLWPDRNGRYPGDEKFAERYEHLQPRLWLPRNEHPTGPWTEQD
jgi:hypothetical protein